MDPLPDLTNLSDQELRSLIEELMEQEHRVSYERRILHGKIDILRAELQARLKRQVDAGESPLSQVDVDKLASILAAKASPTSE